MPRSGLTSNSVVERSFRPKLVISQESLTKSMEWYCSMVELNCKKWIRWQLHELLIGFPSYFYMKTLSSLWLSRFHAYANCATVCEKPQLGIIICEIQTDFCDDSLIWICHTIPQKWPQENDYNLIKFDLNCYQILHILEIKISFSNDKKSVSMVRDLDQMMRSAHTLYYGFKKVQFGWLIGLIQNLD